MIVSTNYSSPVMVNGFSCRNCAEVDQAKKNIDPANPAAGPFGMIPTVTGAATNVRKSDSIDSATIAQTLSQIETQKGSNVRRAYGGSPVTGQLVQLTA